MLLKIFIFFIIGKGEEKAVTSIITELVDQLMPTFTWCTLLLYLK